nr:helix-turn-helix domain-containing protein [Anaerolineae bacterium]
MLHERCLEGEMAKTGANMLTLKEAARILGVHENTLRSWEQRGLIRLIRLPGSRYRRVPVAEVERLAAQMRADLLRVAGVRLDPPPTDADLLAQGQALALVVKEELAGTEWPESLEETMQMLRGRSWLS